MTGETIQTYERLENNFVTWAQAQPDIWAAIVIGSRARDDYPADEWSDLDVILFTADPTGYASRQDWLEQLGEVWLAVRNRTGRGDPEWLVLFANCLKIDIVLATIPDEYGLTATLPQMMEASPYQFVFERGARILFDKNNHQNELTVPVAKRIPPPHPTPDEFITAINQALLSAVRTVKFLKRGELWRAKQLCDGNLKQHLLTMLEWHARASHSSNYDTWYEGKFLGEWADPRALEALPSTFARYDLEELQQALFATLDLFRWLATETAGKLGYRYPHMVDKDITDWIQSTLSENNERMSHGL